MLTPEELELPADFDEEVYLQINPDVWAAIRAGAVHSAQEHWLKHGHSENRPYSRNFQEVEGFDERNYLQCNPDVAAAISRGLFHSGYEHWLEIGEREGRMGATAANGVAWQPGADGVNYFGAQKQATGLGSAAAGYLEALRSAGVATQAFDVPVWHQVMERQNEWDGRSPSLPYNVNIIHQNADAIRLFRKYYGSAVMRHAHNIGLWVWELPGVKPEWHSVTRLFQEIWTPSTFCLHTFAPMSAAPVSVMPHAILPMEAEETYSRLHFGIPENRFIFLYVFDAGSSLERKNPHALVRAFRAAFGERQDVGLALKFTHSELDAPGTEQLKSLAAAPNIFQLSGMYSRAEMVSLFRASDCFVSPHRSEGFGCSIAEAMLLGKPVIATAYSGNMDFTNEENSYLLDFNLVALEKDIGPYVRNSYWADASVSHLMTLMQRVVSDPEEARRKAVAGRETIARDYSAEAIGRRMREHLAERFSTAVVER